LGVVQAPLFLVLHFSKITALGNHIPNPNNPSYPTPSRLNMPGNRPSTPTLLAQGLMETLLQPPAGAVAPLNLPTDHLLHTHLSAFLGHNYEESEIDFLAVLLALSTQNNNLNNKSRHLPPKSKSLSHKPLAASQRR